MSRQTPPDAPELTGGTEAPSPALATPESAPKVRAPLDRPAIVLALGPLPLESNLDRRESDPNTEDTPPTAVPGAFRFEGLEWTEDEEDEDAPPVEQAVAAEAPKVEPAPEEPAPLVAPRAPVAAPSAPPREPAQVPFWAWMLLAALTGASLTWAVMVSFR